MMGGALGLAGLTYEWRTLERPHIAPDGRTELQRRRYAFPSTLNAFPDDLDFIHSRLRCLPAGWRRAVTRSYTDTFARGTDGRRHANRWLDDLAVRTRCAPLPLTANEDAIRAKARNLAKELRRVSDAACADVLKALGLPLPSFSCKKRLAARCRDELWLRRKLRKAVNRAAEDVGRCSGLVHQHAGLYVTDDGLTRRRQQQARNAETLGSLIAVNEEGQEFDLDELIDASIANPSNRRAELMVRARGFETIAAELGHVGDFWTITLPSRFHAAHKRSGQRNGAFDGATVRDGHAHLMAVWARIRAALNRRGIYPYGFRVVEPHHDGTPHWHLLVFLPPEQVNAAREMVMRYALQDSPNEPGALERRCTFQRIDPARGSATGYIAKYIAKNIDGFALRADDPGAPQENFRKDPAAVAERVVGWASIHGIRQFQQIGGPPVGVWREARRLRSEQMGIIERIRESADAADWAAFVRAMGGPTGKRNGWPVRVAYVEWWMTETGELDANRYGEPASLKPYGLESGGLTVPTRTRWEVLHRPEAQTQGRIKFPAQPDHTPASVISSAPWSSVNNYTQKQVHPEIVTEYHPQQPQRITSQLAMLPKNVLPPLL